MYSVSELFDNTNHDAIRFCFTNECKDDDNVFYYGLSEQDIEEAIKNPSESALEFVITSYEIL